MYFLNTKAEKTVAFGPGVFPENNIGKETLFYIQSRNKLGENRDSGGDQFLIEIKEHLEINEDEPQTKEPIVLQYKITDENNGRYIVSYSYEGEPLEFDITIKLKNEFD